MQRLSKLLAIHRTELPPVLLSASYFFTVLCGYNFLRPVREAMGVSGGMNDLRWLFAVTSVVSLVVVLCFGGLVARTNRRKFIPIAYLLVIVCLLLFSGILILDITSGGGLIGSSSETDLSRIVGYVFFVWLSVANLFVTSVFWAFMVDIYTVEQGKRVFAFIGIGGTLGALIGGWATSIISGSTESPYLPVGLMLTGAAFFSLSIFLVLWLDRVTGGGAPSSSITWDSDSQKAPEVGGAQTKTTAETMVRPKVVPRLARTSATAGETAARLASRCRSATRLAAASRGTARSRGRTRTILLRSVENGAPTRISSDTHQ